MKIKKERGRKEGQEKEESGGTEKERNRAIMEELHSGISASWDMNENKFKEAISFSIFRCKYLLMTPFLIPVGFQFSSQHAEEI